MIDNCYTAMAYRSVRTFPIGQLMGIANGGINTDINWNIRNDIHTKITFNEDPTQSIRWSVRELV